MTGNPGRAGLLLIGALVGPILTPSAEGVRVCVGADQVLRQARSGQCPPGAKAYDLAEAGSELEVSPPDEADKADRAELAALQKQVANLSQQVMAAAEAARAAAVNNGSAASRVVAPSKGSAASRVVAPFEVVDARGKPILTVREEPRSMQLLDDKGQIVVAVSALAAGGFVKARAGDGSLETVMGVNHKYAGFVLRQGDNARGSFSIAEDGKPIINMSNDNFVNVVALAQGASGGGYLQLGDASGNAMVEALTTSDGIGLVRAYPLGTPGAGLIGLPGTFILGRKGR
jgi:hypothetical protein